MSLVMRMIHAGLAEQVRGLSDSWSRTTRRCHLIPTYLCTYWVYVVCQDCLRKRVLVDAPLGQEWRFAHVRTTEENAKWKSVESVKCKVNPAACL